MDNIARDAIEAITSLQSLADRFSILLSEKKAGADPAHLRRVTAELKNELKTSNSYWSRMSGKPTATRVEQLFAAAMRHASSELKMRANANPATWEWESQLGDVIHELARYQGIIRSEFPSA